MMKSISHGSLRLLQNDEATELVEEYPQVRRAIYRGLRRYDHGYGWELVAVTNQFVQRTIIFKFRVCWHAQCCTAICLGRWLFTLYSVKLSA